jgi:S-adenosylmethionine uptake transporter
MTAGPAFLYLLGVFLICVMDVLLKHALQTYPVVMANAWRYLFAAIFTFLLWWGSARPRITAAMLPLHILRGLIIAVSAVTFFFAVTRLTLAETITLFFVAPLMVPPLAAVLLGERIEARSVVAGALGFLGVLVAGATAAGDISPVRLEGIVSALVSALTYALATVLLRARAERDDAAAVSLLGALVPALVLFAALAMPGWNGPTRPAAGDIPAFAAAGLCGALSLWLFARAFATQEAQRLAPFEYSALPWLALFGFLFFGEQLAWRTLAGAALIISACFLQAGFLRHLTAARRRPFGHGLSAKDPRADDP